MRLVREDHLECVYRHLQEALRSIEHWERIQHGPWNPEDAFGNIRIVLFPITPSLQKRTFPSFLETFSYVDSRFGEEELLRLIRAIMSREYEMISLLWWMMTLLKSGRAYIDVGLVMSRILVRSNHERKITGGYGCSTAKITHQFSLVGRYKHLLPIQ